MPNMQYPPIISHNNGFSPILTIPMNDLLTYQTNTIYSPTIHDITMMTLAHNTSIRCWQQDVQLPYIQCDHNVICNDNINICHFLLHLTIDLYQRIVGT